MTKLDYERRPPRPAARLPAWQRATAYGVMALPLVGYVVPSLPFVRPAGKMSAHPAPTLYVATMYVLIAAAIGAGLFVVRRDWNDFFGWAAIVWWGSVCLLLIVAAVLG